MATSSIGKIVKLDKVTGKKMVEVLAHPSKPQKPSGTIHTGRIPTSEQAEKCL